MPYKKVPELRYKLFGGINTKVSQYLNSPMEFLTLENLDFQIPGSLVQRWGSTQYFGNSMTGKVNALYEFTKTTGDSYFYAGAGGTLGIAFNGGFSSIYSGSTVGASYFATFGPFTSGISIGNYDFDFDTLQNNAFLGNGKDFYKSTGGSSFVFFGLPRFQCDNGLPTFGALGNSGAASGFTGIYYYQFAWVNSYGMAGAPSQATNGSTFLTGNDFYALPVFTLGATQVIVSVTGYQQTFNGLLPPPNFDITGVAFFRTQAFSTTQSIANINAANYTLKAVMGISALSHGVTFLDIDPLSGITFMNKDILPFNWYTHGTSELVTNLYPYVFEANTGFGITIIPKVIETHANRLFIAGCSYAPSDFFFSEFAEPEHFESDFSFTVRTQDGTPVTAMKEYNGNLMVFKTNSMHLLNTAAEDPINWSLTNVSNEYGCLGNKAVCVYENLIIFLDRKGIIQFNGSNINILSTKVDPIFQRMNLAAASGAVMTYDKQRNEVLCDIPVDGATMNNLTVVYDIIAKGWTTEKGYRSATRTVAQGSLTKKELFYGGYSGLVSYFGGSFLTDNGVGFTLVAKSGFLTDLGETVQKVFRRLFLDTNPVGSTSFIDFNIYQDYGASRVFSASLMLNNFQNRIDFGVSAKSMSAEFMCGSTIGLAMHGFAIQYRFQRNV